MSNREKLFLQMRNRKGQYNETYCEHYFKDRGGYMRFLFFKFQSVSIFISAVILTLFSVFFNIPEEEGIVWILPYIFVGIFWFCWLCIIFIGLWYWKYTRHVFATDEGVWVAGFSTFWWRGAPDFTGKRRFLAPYWSLYSWGELKNIGDVNKNGGGAVSKISNFFEKFDDFVKKSKKYKTVYMTRFDGVESVDFLKNDDAEELLIYARTARRRAKKGK